MIPPREIDVLDGHAGYNVFTFARRYEQAPGAEESRAGGGRHTPTKARLVRMSTEEIHRRGDTLWKPASAFAGKGPNGTLVSFWEQAFYQSNDHATLAIYNVRGYGPLIAVWFDNRTGERIA
jgi:hypothetical protein